MTSLPELSAHVKQYYVLGQGATEQHGFFTVTLAAADQTQLFLWSLKTYPTQASGQH